MSSFLLLLAAANAVPKFSGAASAAQNTTATNDLAADGYTWSNGSPAVVDQYGKIFVFAQRHNGNNKRHIPVVSNDSGATWSEPSRTGFMDANGEGELIRGATVYDPDNDLFHVLWCLNTVDGTENGGVYYREYSVTRDVGTHNITAVTRERQMQIEAGVSGMSFDSPCGLWADDISTVVFAYGAANGGGVGASLAECRATMLAPDGTANDTTAANWAAPHGENAGAGSTDILGSDPAVAYSCLAKSASAQQPFISIFRKPASAALAAKSLHWFYILGGANERLRYNRAAWSAGSSNWSGSFGATLNNDAGRKSLSLIQVAGTDDGYVDKHQLLSKIAYDAVDDSLIVSLPVWKSDTDGDSWAVTGIWLPGGTDAVINPVYVYKAGAANTDPGNDMFVTGDLMVDTTTGLIVVAYTDLPNHDVYFTGLLADDGNFLTRVNSYLVFDDRPADIPILMDDRVGGKIACMFRDFNDEARDNPPTYTPPYDGYWITVSLG